MKVLCPKSGHRGSRRGVALIIVLLTLFALSAMVGIFSYSMKVETRLAMNTSNSTELQWLGRSGVELAKWVLVQQDRVGSERGFHALNQFWAGGPGPLESADNPFAGISLRDVVVGDGKITVQIEDQERFLNINSTGRNPALLDLALARAGADATDASIIGSALMDWMDRDDTPQAGNGAESEFYLGLEKPYRAKNGPIDDIRELLLVRGVTPGLFYGEDVQATGFKGQRDPVTKRLIRREKNASAPVGLNSIFCALSNGKVNINTAGPDVIAALLGGNESLAHEVIKMRSGPDGVDGTEDDEPARGGGDIPRMLGAAGPGFQQLFTTQSTTFAVRVRVELGPAHRVYYALLRRSGARDYQTVLFRED